MLSGEGGVEVGDVGDASKAGLVDGRVLAVEHLAEIEQLEERVPLKLCKVSLARAEPAQRVAEEQLLNQVLDVGWQVGGAAQLGS